jgi:AAA+ superfamily predicted ATPase
MTDDPGIAAVRRAAEAAPTDLPLRLHLAQLLAAADRPDEAITELSAVLSTDPQHPGARELMMRILGGGSAVVGRLGEDPPAADPPTDAPGADPLTVDPPATPITAGPDSGRFDWSAAEDQLGDIAAPMFTGQTKPDAAEPEPAFDAERPAVRLNDVGGMQAVKDRLNAAFLAPLNNPELRRLYGKSLRGGMLLYGPPGCGKTFLARALAGELGASFISAGLAEILDMWVGSSERNLHELFSQARRSTPCVLFLDEIDALGQKRSQTQNSAIRGTVNQLLTELDGISSQNEGLYVLAATNQPWDVDPAMRRPGRLDRTVLVLPPDRLAREAIFRYHLAHRPVAGIDLAALAGATDGYSGADIAYVCESATEHALLDGVRSGTARMIGMADLRAALADVTPSTGAWLETARTVVQYGQDDGTFGELKSYLKKRKHW